MFNILVQGLGLGLQNPGPQTKACMCCRVAPRLMQPQCLAAASVVLCTWSSACAATVMAAGSCLPLSTGAVLQLLCRVWRLDSGNYLEVAALIQQTWSKRCQARQADGLPELPLLKFIHSNISSIGDIKQASGLG